jgi:hypothetical protein
MSAAPPGSPIKKWTWTRWVTLIALVFVLHVALIFIFGRRKPAAPAPVKNAPSLALTQESGGWIALNNATLFGLPNQDSFAGSMWTPLPPLAIRQQDWTEKPHWLTETNPLSVAELVTPLKQFVQTNQFTSIHVEFTRPPALTVPALPIESPFTPDSTLQIEGDLAKRQLLTPIHPPLLSSTDVIVPSKVQVLVDGAGNVISAALLPSENFLETSTPADSDASHQAGARALELARSARFAPLASDTGTLVSNPTSRLSVGLLIFNWQTAPESADDGAKKKNL